MAAGPSQQLAFSNDEKNFLLAELIKSATPSHHLLLDVFKSLRVAPQFEDIPLPPGRSLNSCRQAWEEMRRAVPLYSPLSSAGPTSTPQSAPAASLKRLPGPEIYPTIGGRQLLPKLTGYQYSQSLHEPPLKRKRGRPTKAEVQARAEAAGASTDAQQRVHTPSSASVPASPTVQPRPSSTLPPNRGVPISTIVTPNRPKSASHSGSSSGKRSRQRRSDDMTMHRQDIPQQILPPVYGRPFDRLPSIDDRPARVPPARLRDEPIHSSVTRVAVSEPEQTAGAQPATPSPRILLPPPQPGR